MFGKIIGALKLNCYVKDENKYNINENVDSLIN